MRPVVPILPQRFQPELQAPLARVKEQHETDLAQGFGAVYLWTALERKYPSAARAWIWPYVFPFACGAIKWRPIHRLRWRETLRPAPLAQWFGL